VDDPVDHRGGDGLVPEAGVSGARFLGRESPRTSAVGELDELRCLSPPRMSIICLTPTRLVVEVSPAVGAWAQINRIRVLFVRPEVVRPPWGRGGAPVAVARR
jgi:hypothetical protein